jgi:hypothetical protein
MISNINFTSEEGLKAEQVYLLRVAVNHPIYVSHITQPKYKISITLMPAPRPCIQREVIRNACQLLKPRTCSTNATPSQPRTTLPPPHLCTSHNTKVRFTTGSSTFQERLQRHTWKTHNTSPTSSDLTHTQHRACTHLYVVFPNCACDISQEKWSTCVLE